MTLHRCTDGDRIDLIVLKHYGSLKPLNTVIEANRHLFSKSLILKSGEIVKLPEIEEERVEKSKPKERELLW